MRSLFFSTRPRSLALFFLSVLTTMASSTAAVVHHAKTPEHNGSHNLYTVNQAGVLMGKSRHSLRCMYTPNSSNNDNSIFSKITPFPFLRQYLLLTQHQHQYFFHIPHKYYWLQVTILSGSAPLCFGTYCNASLHRCYHPPHKWTQKNNGWHNLYTPSREGVLVE